LKWSSQSRLMASRRSKSSSLSPLSSMTSSFCGSVTSSRSLAGWASKPSGSRSSAGAPSSRPASCNSRTGFSCSSCWIRSCRAMLCSCRISIDWIIRGARIFVWRISGRICMPMPGPMAHVPPVSLLNPWGERLGPLRLSGRGEHSTLRQPREVYPRRQSQPGRHLAGFFGDLLAGSLQGLVDGGLDQVFEHLLVAQAHGLVAEGAGEHFHLAIDAHLDHARAGIALGRHLSQGLLELLGLLLDLGEVLEQAGNLTKLLEHRSGLL